MQIGSSLPRILPLPTLHRLWRIIKHSVRNDGAASGSLDEPLGVFLFCIYSMTLFLFRAFGMVTLEVRLRFMPSSFWAYLVSKRTHQHHLRLSEKGDNLDKDERGSDEENMTDMLYFLLRLRRVLIALCRRRRGTISPPSDSYHPPHLCLSPWCVLPDSILSSSIQPSDFSRFYLRSPPLTRSFLTPLSSAPKMIKKQTQQPWCPGSTLQLDHALCSFTEGKKKISTSQKDQTDAKPLWCDNFNFDGCRLCKSPLLKSK